MKKISKDDKKIIFTTEMNVSLANALRRSVNEIPVLAFEEVDVYKNDSALYDEMIAHRVGLIPLKNQKVKQGSFVEFKLKTKAKGEKKEVSSGDFGDGVVYDEIPITILEKDQEVEIVARATQGQAIDHAKFSPGIIYYYHLNKIKVGSSAEKNEELAKAYPKVFSFDGKLKVENDWALETDGEDQEEFKGVEITETKDIVFQIESWGQIKAQEIFNESVKALNKNLDEVSKALK